MRHPRILIVDDDPTMIKFIRANLEARDYETFTAMDGIEALSIMERELPDLVILDITMPNMDGIEVCSQLREWSQVPIIMLSALHELENKVKCLDLGADDYITKPFGVVELMARVRAVFRRTEATGALPTKPSFTSGELIINFAQRRVTVSDNEVKLTPTEYRLLEELVLSEGKVLTYTYLLNRVWGTEYQQERDYLHVFIHRLRTKLKSNDGSSEYIMTIPGVGYQFKDNQ